jgi:hypothetical protein
VELTCEGIEVRLIPCIIHMSSREAYLGVVDAPMAMCAEYSFSINSSISLFFSACTRALCCLKTTLCDVSQPRVSDVLVEQEYADALAVVL